MKRFLVGFLILSFSMTMAVRAQDSATQQQIDKLSGQIQDLQATQLEQTKHIQALEKEINDLQGQSNQSGGTASPDDLKKLAEQVQEIDKKRQEDNDRVLKELERLEKSLGASPSSHRSSPDITPDATPAPARGGHPTASTNGPQNGYDYAIQRGDTLLAIVKAYRAQGIKVTTDQVLKANPGLDPKNLKVGQKIFIPAPGQ